MGAEGIRSIRAMVLAAGYGTRLAPVTDHVPKPLLPLGGATLLDHALAVLRRGGVTEVAVNSHHLGQGIADHLAGRPDTDTLHHFPEAEILGTGGPLAAARAFLEETEDFVVFNGDVLCDVDVAALVAAHRRSGRLATLLLVDRPEINTVFVDEEDRILHIRGAGPEVGGGALVAATGLTYSGVAVFSRRFLGLVAPGFGSLITPLVRALEKDPDCVGAYRPADVFWDDLGTLPRYLGALHQVEMNPSGFSWLDPGEGLPASILAVERIRGHGSDRRFWRLATPDWSAVAMQSDRGDLEDDEFRRHLAIGGFLRDKDLGAASILTEDEATNTALMEDLGPDSLYHLARRPGADPRQLAAHYGQVVEHLLRLQAFTEEARATCPLAVDRRLDVEDLRWETDYFRERFLVGHAGLDPEAAGPDSFFADLARRVANQPLVLLHRDFQSQNIHLKDGAVRLVDFQGLRLGPLGYDIMSLLWDPYAPLDDTLRHELLDRFCRACGQPAAQARAMAVAAGLQRLMQALGAYGYLGHVKGKTGFLEHIPQGLKNLSGVLEMANEMSTTEPEAARLWLPEGLQVLEDLLASLDV